MHKSNLVERAWSRRHQETSSKAPALVQGMAFVSADIKPGQRGRVKCLASYWYGRCRDNTPIKAGVQVRLLWREGNTWVVEPLEPTPDAS